MKDELLEEKKIQKFFEDKWKSFLDFEKKGYELIQMYYWKKKNKLVILTTTGYIKFDLDKNDNPLKKIIPNLEHIK